MAEYEDILRRADKRIWLAEQYYSGCMMVRNRYLVEHSEVCLCYLTSPEGGTKYTVDYCRRRGIKVINLADPAPGEEPEILTIWNINKVD